jgi:hypothetical protein
MIASTPNKIIAEGTDWRFLNELKRELTDPHRTAPRRVTRAWTDAIEVIFSFETAQGKGMGVLRLTEDPDEGNRLKAWTLLTALEELNPSHRDERCSPLATRQGVEGRP